VSASRDGRGTESPRDQRDGDGRVDGNPLAEPQTAEEVAQTLADLDQTYSDSDQTTSDGDSDSSEADEASAYADQASADADQRASDRDQAAADRDHVTARPTPSAQRAYDESREERAAASRDREIAATSRVVSALERARSAARRDDMARLRDLTAAARDRAAEARDDAAKRRAAAIGEADGHPDGTILALQKSLARTRSQAAADRARAATDREKAAADRARAADDRRQARIDLHRAHLADLTGVHLHGLGKVALQREIDRATGSNEPFVLAFIGVDGLQQVNDNGGHAAGDDLLKALADAIKSQVRTYDLVVQLGGDEFLCGFTNTTLSTARRRVADIQDALAQRNLVGSIRIGLAALRPDDKLEDLIARGDSDLYDGRRS